MRHFKEHDQLHFLAIFSNFAFIFWLFVSGMYQGSVGTPAVRESYFGFMFLLLLLNTLVLVTERHKE